MFNWGYAHISLPYHYPSIGRAAVSLSYEPYFIGRARDKPRRINVPKLRIHLRICRNIIWFLAESRILARHDAYVPKYCSSNSDHVLSISPSNLVAIGDIAPCCVIIATSPINPFSIPHGYMCPARWAARRTTGRSFLYMLYSEHSGADRVSGGIRAVGGP